MLGKVKNIPILSNSDGTSYFEPALHQLNSEKQEDGYFCVGKAVHIDKITAWADNLPNLGSLGSKTDPYYIIEADMISQNFADLQVEDKIETKRVYKSETINNALTPEWQEAEVEVPVGAQKVTVKVYHDKLGSDELIGSVEVKFENNKFVKGEYSLGEDDRGNKLGVFMVGGEKKKYETFAMLQSPSPEIKLEKQDYYLKIKYNDLTLYTSPDVSKSGKFGSINFKAPECATSCDIYIMEKDTLSSDDFIGKATVALPMPKSQTVELTPEINFAIGEPIKFIASARDLKNKDTLGKSDPYFKLYCGASYVYKSEVIDNNLNPIWKEAAFFPPPNTSSLTLKIFDDDKGRDELLCEPLEISYPIEFKEYPLSKGTFVVQNMSDLKDNLKAMIENCDNVELFNSVRDKFLKQQKKT